MQKTENIFPAKEAAYYFDAAFSYLEELVSKENAVLITDENVFRCHPAAFEGWRTIVIKPGEPFKQPATIDTIIRKLVELEADRKTFIIGVGGGVVTDITGYVACIYMRGVEFGFVPSSILAMVDAAIGGKNGVDIGIYKNLVGLIRQPSFILYDHSLLDSLPQEEWVNGFAEIIKHACIKDAALFDLLESASTAEFKDSPGKLKELIKRNVEIKKGIVIQDEFETGERKLLNFGHTFGHAIENLYHLPHGHAVSIGMVMAADLSVEVNGLKPSSKERIVQLLRKYSLPVTLEFNKEKVMEVLKMDKKRERSEINFILLDAIGKAVIRPIPIKRLEEFITKRI